MLAQAGTLVARVGGRTVVPVVRTAFHLTGLDELCFFARAAKANVQWLHDLADALPDD